MSNFIGLTTMVLRLLNFRGSPLSLEEKVRWALLWRIIVASRCFNFYVKILISGFSRSKTVRSILFLGLKMEILGGGGSWQPQKKPSRIAKIANNRNIVTGQAEFIAGDWITWWRFKFRLYAKKTLSKFIFKSFENFQKIFSFSKIKKSDFFSILAFGIFPFSENISQISIFQISISQISKRQNRKFSDFSILENENIFWKISKLFKIKFDNLFFCI